MLERLVLGVLSSAPPAAVDRTRRLPLVAPLLKGIVTALARPLIGKEIVIPGGEAAGLRFHVDRASVVWATGRVELPVQRALAAALRPGQVFFDVGANVGFYTLLAARTVGPTGRVVAFEPHPENLEVLERNVRLNGFENVMIVRQAVSDRGGVGRLGGGNRATARLDPARGLEVETIALDAAAGQLELVPAVVKIDVEGHELEVLAGAARMLEAARPVIVCELHGRIPELVAVLEGLGYDCGPIGGAAAQTATHLLAMSA